jgi:hypothetical protein
MKSLIRIAKKIVPRPLKKKRVHLVDLFVYHVMPPKTIVLILCSQRSGSTLLKALLAEADDVSHLPEVDYEKHCSNTYRFYHQAYFLSKKRIIVLKHPDASIKPLSPTSDRIKIIMLVRDVYGVVMSLAKMYQDRGLKERGKRELVKYWCDIYEGIINSVATIHQNICFVRYEDLIRNPNDVTKKLFTFIDSKKREGVDSYTKSKDFEWKWRTDDGGEKIKGLRVINADNKTDNEDLELQHIIQQSPRVGQLRNKFGYTNGVTSEDNEFVKRFIES